MLLLGQQAWRCAGSSRRTAQYVGRRDPERGSTHSLPPQPRTQQQDRRHGPTAAAAALVVVQRSSKCSSGSSGTEQVVQPQQQLEQGMDTTAMAQHIVHRLSSSTLSPSSLAASFTAHRAKTPSPSPTPCTLHQLNLNLDLLLKLFTPPQVAKLLQRLHPDLLAHDLSAWHLFFQGLHLPPHDFYTLLMYSPTAILANTPYNAGRAIIFLKSFGISQEDIAARIIPCYPQLLAVPDAQLQEAAEHLSSLGLLEHPEATQRLVQQCPSYFIPSLHAHLLPILRRIQNSRNGKFTNSGSYWI